MHALLRFAWHAIGMVFPGSRIVSQIHQWKTIPVLLYCSHIFQFCPYLCSISLITCSKWHLSRMANIPFIKSLCVGTWCCRRYHVDRCIRCFLSVPKLAGSLSTDSHGCRSFWEGRRRKQHFFRRVIRVCYDCAHCRVMSKSSDAPMWGFYRVYPLKTHLSVHLRYMCIYIHGI